MNSQIRRHCNTRTSLVGVFKFFEGALNTQAERAELRQAELALPTMQLPQAYEHLFKEVMAPITYALGSWPANFLRNEIDAASLFCQIGGQVLDGPDATATLQKLEYIGDRLVDVQTVANVVEKRNNLDMLYIVVGFTDGRHLCSCRVLHTLGLCCRHFFGAMLLTPRFKFHLGLLNKHWLAERGRTPVAVWPQDAVPKWTVASRHAENVPDGASSDSELAVSSGGDWPADNASMTIQSALVEMEQGGPSVQDRRVLYADLVKRTSAVISFAVDSVDPGLARTITDSWEQQMRDAATVGSGRRPVLSNPDTVRLPARSSNKRHKSSTEAHYSRSAGKRRAQQY